MILNLNEMILTSIISSKILKICFIVGASFMGVAALEQQLTEYEFFMAIYKSTPSVVISSFGAVWLGAKMVMAIMDASKSISDAWLHHENNKVMLKEAKERLERNEIDTDIKRKELE